MCCFIMFQLLKSMDYNVYDTRYVVYLYLYTNFMNELTLF